MRKIKQKIMNKKKLALNKARRIYFKMAAEIAQLGDFPRVKIGAIAVYHHRVISSGFNTSKTDPIQKQYNIYRFSDDTPAKLHAELACLKPLIGRRDINFKCVDVYIYRQNKDGTPALSRPCPSCEAFMKKLGIRNIYFTNNGGYSHERILE